MGSLQTMSGPLPSVQPINLCCHNWIIYYYIHLSIVVCDSVPYYKLLSLFLPLLVEKLWCIDSFAVRFCNLPLNCSLSYHYSPELFPVDSVLDLRLMLSFCTDISKWLHYRVSTRLKVLCVPQCQYCCLIPGYGQKQMLGSSVFISCP